MACSTDGKCSGDLVCQATSTESDVCWYLDANLAGESTKGGVVVGANAANAARRVSRVAVKREGYEAKVQH